MGGREGDGKGRVGFTNKCRNYNNDERRYFDVYSCIINTVDLTTWVVVQELSQLKP